MRPVEEIKRRELKRTVEGWLTLYFEGELTRKIKYNKRALDYFNNKNGKDEVYDTLIGGGVIKTKHTNEINDITGDKIANLDYRRRKAVVKTRIYRTAYIELKKALMKAEKEKIINSDIYAGLKETLKLKNRKSIKQVYKDRNIDCHYETFRIKRKEALSYIEEILKKSFAEKENIFTEEIRH